MTQKRSRVDIQPALGSLGLMQRSQDIVRSSAGAESRGRGTEELALGLPCWAGSPSPLLSCPHPDIAFSFRHHVLTLLSPHRAVFTPRRAHILQVPLSVGEGCRVAHRVCDRAAPQRLLRFVTSSEFFL